jgi:glutathione S-transferase
MAVTVYGARGSTWTQTALRTCVEKGARLLAGDRHEPIHPFGRIPIMEIDGRIIIETLAITAALDDRVGEPRLQPTRSADRVRMLTWAAADVWSERRRGCRRSDSWMPPLELAPA